MRALSRREKVLATMVATALLVTLVQQLLLRPQKQELDRVRQELREADRKLAAVHAKLAGLQVLRREVQSKKERLAGLQEELSFEGDISQILHTLTTEARSRGINLQYLRPLGNSPLQTQAGKPGMFQRSTVELGLRCQYRELGEFLRALEQLPYFLRVAGMEVGVAEEKPRLLDVRLRMAIVARGGRPEAI